MGANEAGGSGTAVFVAPSGDTVTRKLFVDNNGNLPLHDHSESTEYDSGRTVIGHNVESGPSSYEFDEVTITGSGHLSFVSNDGEKIDVFVQSLVGDLTGLLHVKKDIELNVNTSQSPFPVSFAVYEGGVFNTPECN